MFHGFLRTPDGAITILNVPGAGTGPGQGTFAGNINPAEAIAGATLTRAMWLTASCALRTAPSLRLMLRTPAQGPARAPLFLPAYCLNPAGAIAGASLDSSDVYHGFLRAPDGTITTFDVPGAGTGPFQGTLPLGINQAGTIEGDYIDSSDVNHGFVRASDGTITTFDVPGAGTGPFQGTSPQGINAAGAVTGEYVDASDVNHGFVRARNGAITTFDVPGAGTGPGQGTIPLSNNPAGAITGYYIDASDVTHGFLRTP